MMIFVIMFCVSPWVPLKTTDVKYKPYCAEDAVLSTVGDSGTTYDDVFQSAIDTRVKVPGLYALVMDWASGFTNALIVGSVPCDTNINHLMQMIVTSKLTTDLKQQVSQFNQVCYAKARARFDSEKPDKETYKRVKFRGGGDNDLYWMGSHVLRQLYYSDLYPQNGIPGFSYDRYPSKYIDDAVAQGAMDSYPDDRGYPSCEDWWSDPENGLQSRIVKQVDVQQRHNPHMGGISSTLGELKVWLAKKFSHYGADVTAEDVMTRSILYDSDADYAGFASNDASVDTNNNNREQAIVSPLLHVGQAIKKYTGNAFDRQALSDILPILQAVAFFFLIVFMPLVQIFGRYRLGVCISLSFIILSLIFVNYIWVLLNYFETAIINSTTNPYTGHLMGQHAALSNFITTMYIAGPLLLFTIMSIAGVKVGAAMNDYFHSTGGTGVRDASNTGKSIVGIAKKL